MRSRTLGFTLLSVLGAVALPVQADDDEDFAARLKPFEEVPSVSSVASGSFRAELNSSATALTYTLTYRNLEGAVQQAHIHFGDKDVNGGISIWLCSNLASPPTPPNTQACPMTTEATITGTVGATQTVGPVPQGIDAGQFAEIVRAIREGLAYANVHSDRFPGGEIRGQIERRRGNRDHDD
jgi:hypothetical protein